MRAERWAAVLGVRAGDCTRTRRPGSSWLPRALHRNVSYAACDVGCRIKKYWWKGGLLRQMLAQGQSEGAPMLRCGPVTLAWLIGRPMPGAPHTAPTRNSGNRSG